MYSTIIDALRRGAATEALDLARAAVAENAQDPAAHRLMAAALRLGGDREAAIASIDHAIALAPEDADLHLQRAGLLLQESQPDEAQAALARSIGLDPNRFPAYMVQAHLALSRGDIDEADRLARTAARIAPEHPQLVALEGLVALGRGATDKALARLSHGATVYPEETTLRYALGLAYLAAGHFAFAEQAFRSLIDGSAPQPSLRGLLADLLRRQDRPAEAAAELMPLLDTPGATPALRRLVGELQLQAGDNAAALPLLREAFRQNTDDRRTLVALVETWRRLGATDEARTTIDALLSAHPQHAELWLARLVFEEFSGEGALAVIDRWQSAMPDFVPALEARMKLHQHAGERDLAEAVARRITQIDPGHAHAELWVIDALLKRDPEAAVAHVEQLIARADNAIARNGLRGLLGLTCMAAGMPGKAIGAWSQLQSDVVGQRLPLPRPGPLGRHFPEAGTPADTSAKTLFLWGPPGSMVERLASFGHVGLALHADRFGPHPPEDLFQRYQTIEALAEDSSSPASPAALVAEWRAALPGRGAGDGVVVDWLPWWDNALLAALRPHLSDVVLIVAVRDPRDMLLDWLAYGSPAPFALESPLTGAQWLAQVLAQLAELHERDLFAHHLVRLDHVADDPAGVARMLAQTLQREVIPAVPSAFGPRHFPAGHWRTFAGPLAAEFAVLTPLAQRLGYPET